MKMSVSAFALLGLAGLVNAQVPNRPPTYQMNRLAFSLSTITPFFPVCTFHFLTASCISIFS